MKNKKNVLILLFIIVGTGIYIWFSTMFINERTYRKLGWKASDYSDTIINWEEAEVKLVNLDRSPEVQERFLSYGDKWGKVNQSLLFLNGNNAVYVCFNTTQDGLLGPIGLYFNPFTKQIIGIDIRM
jgi:hypothetical protein